MVDEICELPDGYEPSDHEEFMNPRQLEYFRRKLLQWKEEVTSNWNLMKYLQEETDPGTDFGDRVSVENDVRCELRAKNRELKLLEKIDAALQRIENHTYGYCEVTGEPIGLKRLMARPIATLSIEVQEIHERAEKTRS